MFSETLWRLLAPNRTGVKIIPSDWAWPLFDIYIYIYIASSLPRQKKVSFKHQIYTVTSQKEIQVTRHSEAQVGTGRTIGGQNILRSLPLQCRTILILNLYEPSSFCGTFYKTWTPITSAPAGTSSLHTTQTISRSFGSLTFVLTKTLFESFRLLFRKRSAQ